MTVMEMTELAYRNVLNLLAVLLVSPHLHFIPELKSKMSEVIVCT